MHKPCGNKASLSSLLLALACALSLASPVSAAAEEVAPVDAEPTVVEESSPSDVATAEEGGETEERLMGEESSDLAGVSIPEDVAEPEASALTEEEQFLAAQADALVEIDEYQGTLLSAASVGRTTPPDASNAWFYSDTNPYYYFRDLNLAPCGVAYGGKYVVGNCTWYAWGRAAEALGYAPDLGRWMPLDTWDYVCENGIYPTGSTPRVGALAIGETPYGSEHIAYVEEVRNGVGYVSESFYGTSTSWPGYAKVNFRCGVPVSYAISNLVGYIYLPVSTDRPTDVDVPEEREQPVDLGPVSRFPDVPQGHWAISVIEKAADRGIITGYGDGTFGPNNPVTRGQAAVILWRIAGSPRPSSNAKNFPDVQDGAYYYTAVRWASSVGVVSGYADGSFGPYDSVTREQLAVMLANYAEKVAHKAVEGSADSYASMWDEWAVSGWASKAVGWCFANGLLSGSGEMVLPQNTATRAQSAKMFVRFCENVL